VVIPRCSVGYGSEPGSNRKAIRSPIATGSSTSAGSTPSGSRGRSLRQNPVEVTILVEQQERELSVQASSLASNGNSTISGSNRRRSRWPAVGLTQNSKKHNRGKRQTGFGGLLIRRYGSYDARAQRAAAKLERAFERAGEAPYRLRICAAAQRSLPASMVGVFVQDVGPSAGWPLLNSARAG